MSLADLHFTTIKKIGLMLFETNPFFLAGKKEGFAFSVVYSGKASATARGFRPASTSGNFLLVMLLDAIDSLERRISSLASTINFWVMSTRFLSGGMTILNSPPVETSGQWGVRPNFEIVFEEKNPED